VFLAPELVRAFTPLQLAIGRYLAYGAISALLLAPRWRRVMGAMTRASWMSLLWLALAGNTLYYVLLSSGIQMGHRHDLAGHRLPARGRDHRGQPGQWRGASAPLAPSLALCGAGAVCIGWQALAMPGTTGHPVAGLLCAIGALISWSAYAVGNSRCLARLDHVSVQDWNLLTGLVTGGRRCC
jgi:drug/metabolite transporter (DMT)-like permease